MCLVAWQGGSGLEPESANQKIKQVHLTDDLCLSQTTITQAPWLEPLFLLILYVFPVFYELSIAVSSNLQGKC